MLEVLKYKYLPKLNEKLAKKTQPLVEHAAEVAIQTVVSTAKKTQPYVEQATELALQSVIPTADTQFKRWGKSVRRFSKPIRVSNFDVEIPPTFSEGILPKFKPDFVEAVAVIKDMDKLLRRNGFKQIGEDSLQDTALARSFHRMVYPLSEDPQPTDESLREAYRHVKQIYDGNAPLWDQRIRVAGY